MNVTLKIPRISMNMEEATLRGWHVEVGQQFAQGDLLYEIETEKVVTDVEAPGDGRLVEILIHAGVDCKVGDPVCKVET